MKETLTMSTAIKFLVIFLVAIVGGQVLNRPPEFLPGGDLNGLVVNENTSVGTIVYTLKAKDPEGQRVFYYISGDTFSVDKDTGSVKLIKPLDREEESILDVIVTVTDEKIKNTRPNTVSIQREVKVGDSNDNYPVFTGLPYAITVSEATHPFTTVFEGIFVTDADSGTNSQVTLDCLPNLSSSIHNHEVSQASPTTTTNPCDVFHVHSALLAEGKYRGSISLKAGGLNFESVNQYKLMLMARDRGGLNATVQVTIDVSDVQDEPPKFLDTPYVVNVKESQPADTPLLTIRARDGDATQSLRRPLKLSLIRDHKRYFDLRHTEDDVWVLHTTQQPVDREEKDILAAGGVYEIQVKAAEMVNGRESGDFSMENITVTILDVNDQRPSFSLKNVQLPISEGIANGSRIPDLELTVTDLDSLENSKFVLSLEDSDPKNPASSVFDVSPKVVTGSTKVTLKVINSNLIDYENDLRRRFEFNIVATEGDFEKTVSHIILNVVDANDHAPTFDSDQYMVQVPENAPPKVTIFALRATDLDSNDFGRISYSIEGPGSERFFVDSTTGDIGVRPCEDPTDLLETCLDFETQPTFNLKYVASDGGGRKSAVTLFVEVLDVNDNLPVFQPFNTTVEVVEGDRHPTPQLFLRAVDRDGPVQGGNEGIRYFIKDTNLTSLVVDAVTGQIGLNEPAVAEFSPVVNGTRHKISYSAVIQAVDGGQPPLASEVAITIAIRSERDGAPFFLEEPYSMSIREDSVGGRHVLKVSASDPDGEDALLRYTIVAGSKGNFDINAVTGDIFVTRDANLDRELSGDVYDLTVAVIDSNQPLPLMTTTIVRVTIQDANNKPPKFVPDNYVVFITDRDLIIGKDVVKVNAVDLDVDAHLKYAIDLNSIIVRDRTGFPMGDLQVADHFSINNSTGLISVSPGLDLAKAATFIVPVTVSDLNAIPSTAPQQTRTEVTIYVQRDGGHNPIFASPWTSTHPDYEIHVPEETILGSTLMTLSAKDSLTGGRIADFEKVSESDPKNYFKVDSSSGVISLIKRIDFEELRDKHLKFSVRARSGAVIASGHFPMSTANIIVHVQDVNDHSPRFSQEEYSTTIPEDIKWPQIVLTVLAADKDSGPFGIVQYSLSGDGSSLFDIDPISGVIRVREGVVLDREVRSTYSLQVTATDNPEAKVGRRSTSVLAKISLSDVNDNGPTFEKATYEAHIPENVPIGFVVGKVKAVDPDDGENGKVTYEVVGFDDSPLRTRFFCINAESGLVTVCNVLSGKGRRDPYAIEIRAMDHGKPQRLYSDVVFTIFIGDISANDGVPVIVRPSKTEVISVSENSKPGSFVYQVEAVDPDNSNHPNGKVMFKFLDPTPFFDIDPVSGVITTSTSFSQVTLRSLTLDRERTENFTLILVAYDLGLPPQETHQVVHIRVTDIDDNEATFLRHRESPPLVFQVEEELPIGSQVAKIKAVDLDAGHNGLVAYEIISGNMKDMFEVTSTDDGYGIIKNVKRLDREKEDRFLLTIKAGHPKRLATDIAFKASGSVYDKNDLSQVQVEILVKDIDDNPPTFEQSSYVVGVKYNLDVHEELVTIRARDPDVTQSASDIELSLSAGQFIQGRNIRDNIGHIFELDPLSGVLRNAVSLRSFVGGHFNLTIRAMTKAVSGATGGVIKGKPMSSIVNCKIFILKDKDFLKFTFNKRPDEVKKSLKDLRRKVSQVLQGRSSHDSDDQGQDDDTLYGINFDQINFLERKDGSLDFEGSSACFQLIKTRRTSKSSVIVDQKEGLRTLSPNQLTSGRVDALRRLYQNFGVVSVDECVVDKESYRLSRSEAGLILVGIFIAIASIFLICVSSSMRRDLKDKLQTPTYMEPIYVRSPIPFGPVNPFKAPSFISLEDQQRIQEWQEEVMPPQLDTVSFRSFPTIK